MFSRAAQRKAKITPRCTPANPLYMPHFPLVSIVWSRLLANFLLRYTMPICTADNSSSCLRVRNIHLCRAKLFSLRAFVWWAPFSAIRVDTLAAAAQLSHVVRPAAAAAVLCCSFPQPLGRGWLVIIRLKPRDLRRLQEAVGVKDEQ